MSLRLLLLIVSTLAALTLTVVKAFRSLRFAAVTVASAVPIVIVKALLLFASNNGVLPRRALTLVSAIVAVTTPVVKPSRVLALVKLAVPLFTVKAALEATVIVLLAPLLPKAVVISPSVPVIVPAPVSYTHLTLPTR